MNYDNLNIKVTNKAIIIIASKNNRKNKYVYLPQTTTIEIVSQETSIPINEIYELINLIKHKKR